MYVRLGNWSTLGPLSPSDIEDRSAVKDWDAVVTIILQWLVGCPLGKNLKILICLS